MSAPIQDYYQTVQLSLAGVTTPINAIGDYTATVVGDNFSNYIQQIANVYNVASSPGNTATMTAADVTTVNNALAGLYNLAQNGVVVNGVTNYLTTQMASTLDTLARTFVAAGFSIPGIPSSTDQVAALQAWKDLSTLSSTITAALQAGLNSPQLNQSLQAMIEIDYVAQANNMVEGQLGTLQTALSTTQSVLNTLAAVQGLHNQVAISSKPPFGFDYLSGYGSGSNYVNAYTKAGSQYFGTVVQAFVPGNMAITTTVTSTRVLGGNTLTIYGTSVVLTSQGQQMINQLQLYRNSIIAEISNLNTILTASQKTATGSLYSSLQTVLSNLPNFSALTAKAAGPVTVAESLQTVQYSSLTTWLTDNYNSTTDYSAAGTYQNNITQAITAAQSLNDTQSQNVQNYLFIFQQYYNSASTILQSLTQIIQQIAQGIQGR